MINFKSSKKFFSLLLLIVSFQTITFSTFAATFNADQPQIIPKYNMAEYDKFIENLYKNIDTQLDIDKKVAILSQSFLGVQYVNGALGEGPDGEFDKAPLYRTDAFDCMTFVSTILALAESSNLNEFKNSIKKINYKNGNVAYVNRDHFTNVDWNKNNTYNGYLQSVAYKILNVNKTPIAVVSETIINKSGWFSSLKPSAIRTFTPLSPSEQQSIISALHAQAHKVQQEKSVLLYIPLTELFDKEGKPNEFVFAQIPNASVIEIVRPNWDLQNTIGTHLDISHMGIALRDQRGLIFREASAERKAVIDIPLNEYLQNYLHSPTIKGITIKKISAPTR